MFRTKYSRNTRSKKNHNTKKTPQYVEDYNEVILNDLVDEDKNNDINVNEEHENKPRVKRKKESK